MESTFISANNTLSRYPIRAPFPPCHHLLCCYECVAFIVLVDASNECVAFIVIVDAFLFNDCDGVWMQGFRDKETNMRLLMKNDGSIKRVVMDLLNGE